MSSIIRTLNKRRAQARDERNMWRVINSVGAPALRDELIVMHEQRVGGQR